MYIELKKKKILVMNIFGTMYQLKVEYLIVYLVCKL